MSLTLVTAADGEPITLEQAKAQLRLDTDDDDAYVLDLIAAAREHVEGQTRRALKQQTFDYAIDGGWPLVDGLPMIQLPINPVVSVTSISYQDASGTSPEPTLAAADYAVTTRNNGSYIVPGYNVTWPSVRDVPDAITVRFVAGYTTIPAALKHAIKLLVAHLYENREPVSRNAVIASVPYTVEALLSPFRSGRVAS